MKNFTLIIPLILISVYIKANVSLDLFANYETIGITIHLDIDDPEMDAYGTIEYKKSSENIWRTGFPLSRMNNNLKMVCGSIFWLDQGTAYDIKVSLVDPSTVALNGFELQGNISTKSEPSFSTNGQVYHVSPSGSGTDYTLQEALNLAEAGDKVLLQDGNYYTGNLTIPNNGNAANPILIEGAGNNVVINGAHEEELIWTLLSSDVYYTFTKTKNPNLVIADGMRFYPHQIYQNLRNNKINYDLFSTGNSNMPGFYRNPSQFPNVNDPAGLTDSTLYVKFLNGENPNDKDIIVTKQENAFTLNNNSHIIFRNLSIENYGRAPLATAVIVNNSDNITFDNCRLSANNSGILLGGDSKNILIQNSIFEDYYVNWTAWKTKATIDVSPFNQVFGPGGRYLEKGGVVYSNDFYGKGIVIRNNLFQNYNQAGKITPSAGTAGPFPLDTHASTLEVDFYNNTIKNTASDAFEIDNFARNVRVFNNRFENCHAPLSLAAAEDGPLYILRNVMDGIPQDEYILGGQITINKGHPLKFQQSNSEKVNGDIFFFHNTVNTKSEAFGMNLSLTNPNVPFTNFVSKNNIIQSDDGKVLRIRTKNPAPVLNMTNNGYYSIEQATNNSNFKIACAKLSNVSETCYTSIEDIFSNFGFEENYVYANPDFIDASNGDYNLDIESPMIDAGVLIQGINENYIIGSAPDIGAFENGIVNTVHISEENLLSIYPNPTTGLINISTDESIETIDVFNSVGHFILRQNTNGKNTQINLGTSKGLNLLKVTYSSGKIIYKKIINIQ